MFDDTITEMCQELKSGVVPILIPTPNAVHDLGYNRDRYDIIDVMLPRSRPLSDSSIQSARYQMDFINCCC